MVANLHLLFHDLGFGISALLSFVLAAFTVSQKPRKTANIALALGMVSSGVFCVSHIIGVTVSDPEVSRAWLMLNVSTIFIVSFNLHAILAFLGLSKKRRYVIYGVYAVGISLALVYLIFPQTFLELSVPKMYFPNYYVPGPYHWIMRVLFNGLIPLYFMYELIAAFLRSRGPVEQNRFRYFFLASVVGYGVGSIPILLVYNVPADPIWGSLYVLLYSLPMVYAMVKYELLDIRVIAKEAFFYALAVIAIGGLISLFDFSSQYIEHAYPDFPFFVIPLISAILGVGLAAAVWRKLREGDLLKYEFITTVTHKFRTPLTHIKWATENLLATNLPETERTQLEYVATANAKLVELTGLLMNVSETENSAYEYHLERTDISALADEAATSVENQMKIKHITLIKHTAPGMFAMADPSRIKFIVQTFVENAMHYSPDNATITVLVSRQGNNIICSVKDTGIGISKEELPLLFAKFYRGHSAKLADTEGMGIGLFMSREIISRHKGRIWAESEGQNKGSTFSFSVPAVD